MQRNIFKLLISISFFAFILFILPSKVFATAYVSAGSGNWNNSATWTPTGIPGDGDTVKIANNHTVTIPVGYHAIIGVSGVGGEQQANDGPLAAIGCNGGSANGANGSGILNINGYLTFRGNVEQCLAVWNIGADAIIEHDSSLASSPSTTHYRWVIGAYLFPDTTKLVARGTKGHRVLIRNAASSGTFYGFTQYYGAVQGSGQYDFEYTSIDGCGSASVPCAQATNHGSNALIARCDHCLVTNSGYIGATGIGVVGQICSITNSTLTSSTDSSSRTIRVTFGGAGQVTLDTIYTDGQIGLGDANDDNATGTHLRNIVIHMASGINGIDVGGAHFQVGEIDRLMKISDTVTNGGVYAYLPGGTSTRLMGLTNATSNPYFFHGPAGVTGNADVVDGAWLENMGGGGDGDAFGSTQSVGSFTLKNAVIPCPLSNGIAMSLENMPTNSLHNWSIQNTTYCGKDDGQGSARGFGFELTGTTPVGIVSSIKNNLVFCTTSPCTGYLLHQGPTGTPQAGSYQNVDYNWLYNITTGPYLKAVLWSSGNAYVVGDRVQYTDGHSYVSIQNGTNKIPPSQPAFWSLADDEYANPNPPGQHDSSGNPNYIEQRHFLDWGKHLDPSITSWIDIVNKFAKMNDDTGYDPRFNIADAYNWLRDGYRPRNPALMTAGSVGDRVGAMDLNASFSANGTSYKWQPGMLANQGQ